jgi:hypothetical protein
VIFVRCRTVAKVDSMGFVVRRWIQCSAGKSSVASGRRAGSHAETYAQVSGGIGSYFFRSK